VGVSCCPWYLFNVAAIHTTKHKRTYLSKDFEDRTCWLAGQHFKRLNRSTVNFVFEMMRKFSRGLNRSVSQSFQLRKFSAHELKQKHGQYYEPLFKSQIRKTLTKTGYIDLFRASCQSSDIFPMIVSARGKRITIAAEFDAMVLGDSKTFNRFSSRIRSCLLQVSPNLYRKFRYPCLSCRS